jgi:malate synthase
MTDIKLADGTPERPAGEGVLTPEALQFLGELGERFRAGLRSCCARELRQERLDAGELPDFLPETRSVREGDWRVGPIPADLQDRRVEITGPTDRKMIINALNSGARVFMADCEDSLAPSLGQRHRRPGEPARCRAAADRLHQRRGQGLPARPRRPPC